ncbi:regulatory iron-sulfur-containing complex subunit RicT [Flavisolibacter ginsenosidimutans]|nr:regulatory iron-sulfur-containing complex subunit RicT [Flavisolibacter ginsenosidimutans]
MGCGSCGTGKPNGCKSNGGCSTGSCNRMNTHDWLRNLPIADTEDACRVVEISFNQGSRKDYYRNSTLHHFEKGDMVALEGVSGFDVGEVSLTGEIVRLQLKKRGVNEMAPDMKKILRRASDRDLDSWKAQKSREKEALIRSRAIAKQLNLNMKMSQVEFQADGKKGTFFYIADDRVDFRELIKIYAAEFKVKVEMRQIGARQESGKVGGIGSCGRELCCATWLTDFKSVNTAAARYQNLSINQTKLSGQCGRLKCCLNYELDTYLDALQGFPENCDMLQVAKGTATLIKKDIFKNLMWYVLPQSTKQYPLTIERVRKIKALNQQNILPEELEAVEVVSTKVKEVEPEFVDVVGHISLRSLEKADKKRRDKNREQRSGNRQQPAPPASTGGNKQSATGSRQVNPQNKGGENRQATPGNVPRSGQQGRQMQKPAAQPGQRPQKPMQQRDGKPQQQRPLRPQQQLRKPQQGDNKEQPNTPQ